MCRPDYYGVQYKINPWMNLSTEGKPDPDKAMDQWMLLHNLIVKCGGEIHYIPPVDGLPDMVFTANAGLPLKGDFILSRFKYVERTPEEEYFRDYFEEKGFKIIDPFCAEVPFEGKGDVLKMGDAYCFGSDFRSSKHAASAIKEWKLIQVHEMKLKDERFYHLDTCFCPISRDLCLAYIDAFESFSVPNPAGFTSKVIGVSEKEALNFACNAVVIGKNVIMPTNTDATAEDLRKLGYIVHQTPMSEFIKSGGACKCLVLEF